MSTATFKAPVEPKRDRWGRYLLPNPLTGEDEVSYTRATTISGLLDDRYNLEAWAQRMTLLGLAKRPDLVLRASQVRDPKSYNGKRTLNGLVKDAQQAAGSGAQANIGTAIHSATEALDTGGEVNIAAPYDRDVEAYRVKMQALGIEVVPGFVERIVCLPELVVAGTLDRMVRVPGWDLPVIADLKTGSTVHFAELSHSIQQSIYANASHYVEEWDAETGNGVLVPMPPVDKTRALIIHLPAGEARCEVHVLDIERGFEAARIASAVHKWRKAKDLSKPLGESEDS